MLTRMTHIDGFDLPTTADVSVRRVALLREHQPPRGRRVAQFADVTVSIFAIKTNNTSVALRFAETHNRTSGSRSRIQIWIQINIHR